MLLLMTILIMLQWVPPPEAWIEINFDGACGKEEQSGGMGVSISRWRPLLHMTLLSLSNKH